MIFVVILWKNSLHRWYLGTCSFRSCKIQSVQKSSQTEDYQKATKNAEKIKMCSQSVSLSFLLFSHFSLVSFQECMQPKRRTNEKMRTKRKKKTKTKLWRNDCKNAAPCIYKTHIDQYMRAYRITKEKRTESNNVWHVLYHFSMFTT